MNRIERLILAWALMSCGDSPPSGLELEALDESVEPCADFYRYACGGWIDANPVSSDAAREARFTQPFYDAVPQLRLLVEDAAISAVDPNEKLIAQHFQACIEAFEPILGFANAARNIEACKAQVALVEEELEDAQATESES